MPFTCTVYLLQQEMPRHSHAMGSTLTAYSLNFTRAFLPYAMAVQDENDSLHSSKDISSSSKKTTKIIPPKPHNRKVQNCHKVRQHTRAHHCLKLHEHFKTQIYICLYIFLSNIIAFSTKGRVYTKELSHWRCQQYCWSWFSIGLKAQNVIASDLYFSAPNSVELHIGRKCTCKGNVMTLTEDA